MLNILANFSSKELEDSIREDMKRVIAEMANQMFEAGKIVIDRARAKTKSEGGFGNITWNLRGSIGCALLINHTLPEEYIYFPQIDKGDEGRKKGIDFVREIALLVDDGDPVLIMVAGETYAFYVQAMGKDVLRGSTGAFNNILKSVLKGAQI